jgi:hypothetical protein
MLESEVGVTLDPFAIRHIWIVGVDDVSLEED